MTTPEVTENRQERLTALQRLSRNSAEIGNAAVRLGAVAGLIGGTMAVALLLIDVPFRGFDRFFAPDTPLRPSTWLTSGLIVMAISPLIAILCARKLGGDETSRGITAGWSVLAVGVFLELSYLAPVLETGDFPPLRFLLVFIIAAMSSQYMAASIYDVARGGDRWWRAPFYSALGAHLTFSFVYFPGIFVGWRVPWANWLVTYVALAIALSLAFLPIYAFMRASLKPRGGFGGI